MGDWLNKLLTDIFGTYVLKGRKGTPMEEYTEGGFLRNVLGKNKPKTETENVAPVEPTPTPMPTPTPTPAVNEELIKTGLGKWRGTQPPIATASAQLAQAGESLPDPLLPAILSLMESGGLTNELMAAYSNPFGIMSPGSQNLVNYPDLSTAILGGDGRLGLAGLLRPGGIYENYLQSGDISDFFRTYTPENSVNPSNEELVQRYNLLRELFL